MLFSTHINAAKSCFPQYKTYRAWQSWANVSALVCKCVSAWTSVWMHGHICAHARVWMETCLSVCFPQKWKICTCSSFLFSACTSFALEKAMSSPGEIAYTNVTPFSDALSIKLVKLSENIVTCGAWTNAQLTHIKLLIQKSNRNTSLLKSS